MKNVFKNWVSDVTCYSYLATSIYELTQSYNNRLHMDEDINDEFDIKNEKQYEDCELDNAEMINIHKTVDVELNEKISGIFL